MRRILCAFGLAAAGLLAAAAPPAAGLEPGHLTDDQIRIVLRARGYSGLSGIEREGDTVQVTEAMRYGEATGPLRLDAKTGQVRDEPPLAEAQIRTMLRTRGFSEVEELRREGDGGALRARARRGESRVEMRIDPRTGTVTGQEIVR